MSEQVPSLGRIVHYRLGPEDVKQINRRRTTGAAIAAQILVWPAGAQAHIGNEVKEGDVFPMIITRVWGTEPTSAVNGQVLLDGTDVFWATSTKLGDGPYEFSWPPRT